MNPRKMTRFIGWTHDSTFGDPLYESHQHRRYPWNLLSHPLPGCEYCVISKQRQMEMTRLFRIPASKLPVVPDGIYVPELLDLTPEVEQLFHDEELSKIDLVAITPSRILRRKNLGLGMEIVAALKKRGRSVRWIVTGPPDPHNPESMKYFEMLRALRRKLGLQKEAIFLCERFEKPLSNEGLRALYNVSDMLLFPSDREGFGLPVLEAGVFGLLTVISDIPALREIGGRDAIYTDSGHSTARIAADVIAAMKKRPEMLFRKKILSRYSWDVVFANKILPAVMKPKSVWK